MRRRRGKSIGGAAAALLALLVWAAPAPAATPSDDVAKPRPATYEVGKDANVAVPMSDGTILRADVYYPTDPGTGQAAQGPFPVIMVQTPYGLSLIHI